jgi:hypothetical protein
MQLRHISPRSSDWVDAMDEGGRGWEKLGPEERSKLRIGAQAAGTWGSAPENAEQDDAPDDYGWGKGSASR